MMAIRKGDWKLARNSDYAYREDPIVLTDLSMLELYNLKDDISETKNLASSNPKKVIELAHDWTQWTSDSPNPAGYGPPHLRAVGSEGKETGEKRDKETGDKSQEMSEVALNRLRGQNHLRIADFGLRGAV